MFKLESYITPIILSYVNRYINNFKSEDSQVSLWGGDATFHNLELNLEVLEQELQLPFSFVSGSIRELSIHVPWTKIASEPIRITINTIECILNLKGKGFRKVSKKKGKEKVTGQSKTVEAPPGYIQSLINKIVSNISIHCNNLILKYVEEDIVLSMNVKLLKFESANEKWEPAYTDLSPAQVTLRKVISVSDLTLCLDKRNASGKIEIYQEPMLYRCSMTMHLLRHYHSSTANVASTTRLDIYCNNMEFSVTEQQVPMLMRLLMLLYALHQKQLKPIVESSTEATGSSTDNKGESKESAGTWTGWAWSYVSSVLPAPWEEDIDQEELKALRGHSLHFGLYVDQASITFKVSESVHERGYYSQKKLRYHPMLTMDLQGIYIDTFIHGLQWFNCTGGVSEATFIPTGPCSCGHLEVNESTAPYLKLGSASNFHKVDSLFDADAIENQGGKRQYNTSWDHHMSTTTESVLLEKTPAMAFDYVYQLEIPGDMSSDILSDLGSNLECSNLLEISTLRLCIGPFKLRICSGLIHRCNTIQVASSFYDYPPYYTPKEDLLLHDLLPPSEDDFDALNEFIPTRAIRITFFAPIIELELLDHPFFEPTKTHLFERSKKVSTANMPTSTSVVPKIIIECQFIDITQHYPMYVERLVHTTCQLPEPPKKLFDACYVTKSVKIVGFLSRLVTNPACQSIMLTPSSVSYSSKRILKPQYWVNCDIPHDEIIVESENFTLNGTKAKMMVAYNIVEKLLVKESGLDAKSMYGSSLLSDACKDFGFPYMEICIEGIRFKKVVTNSTQTIDASIHAIKGFIFEPIISRSVMPRNLQQVLFISGPEITVGNEDSGATNEIRRNSLYASQPLFTLMVQFPLIPDMQRHPPIFIFNLQEIKICVDPLLCKWLLYVPRNFLMGEPIDISVSASKNKSFSEASGSGIVDTPRRPSSNHLESVHSSSDPKIAPRVISDKLMKEEPTDVQEKVYNLLKKWFNVWKGIFLSGDMSQCTIYFPMSSLSAVGSQGIQEAIEEATVKNEPPDILVITLPFATIKSVQRQTISKYLKHLPISLPNNIWSPDKSSFPWTISITDLSCYTMQNKKKLIFLRPVSLSATVGLSTRPSKNSAPSVPSNVQDDKKKDTASQAPTTKKDTTPVDQKRKGSKNTNMSAASSSNAQYGKSNTSSTPTSPASQSKKVQKKSENSTVSLVPDAGSKVDIGYLGVCVHIDTTPIEMSTQQMQVYLFASILYGFMEVVSNLLPKANVNIGCPEVAPSLLTRAKKNSGSSTLSPTQIKEGTMDSISDKSLPPGTIVNPVSLTTADPVKLTAWVQWTITKFSFELLSADQKEADFHQLKLVLDAEDIVSSLDFQNVYIKIKSKVGTASIQHYERFSPSSKWQPGVFSGIVMRLRDDLPSSLRQEESCLISLTVTRASCQHTHTLWGAVQKKNKSSKLQTNTHLLSNARYITEVVVSIQPLDFVVSLNTLRSFYLVMIPLMTNPIGTSESLKSESIPNTNISSTLSNQTLPLAYLDCQEIRVIMPSKELLGGGVLHDTIIFQVQKICLNPQAVNPICRTPIRPDLYEQAAHARILNVPGSEVEDRQYQLDIGGISISTGTWEDIHSVLIPTTDLLSNLRGMSENPALEWNILEQGQPNSTPTLNLRYILEKYDITVVAAPLMVYKDSTIICGHSMEINLVSDILVTVSLHQLKLSSAIVTEFVTSVAPFIVEGGVLRKPIEKFPYSRLESSGVDQQNFDVEMSVIKGQNKDSGIDTSDVRSIQSSKVPGLGLLTRQSIDNSKQLTFPRPPVIPYTMSSVPVDIIMTAGKVGFTLYSVDDERINNLKYKNKKKKASRRSDDDQGYEASEESTDDRSNSYRKYIPLLYVSLTQPNFFYAKQQIGKKMQISCFDFNLKISGPEYPAVNKLPCEEDFSVKMLETKAGTPNSSGILPAFFTFRFSKGISKNSKVELEILRPTKVVCQPSKWSHLLNIKDKVVDIFKSGGGSESFMFILKAINARSSKEENIHLRSLKVNDTFTQFERIKDILGNIKSVTIKSDQLILAILSETGHELHVGMRELKSQLFLTSRPEKICLLTTFDCFTLTVVYDSFCKLLLHPWTITFDICVFWESWQDSDSDPQIEVTAESDCILLDITAEQIKCVKMVLSDLQEFIVLMLGNNTNTGEFLEQKLIEKDQHYKDDLRAGAFQFVDSATDNTDEMPLPYQVMFWTVGISAMAWKYPQPRALTKVRVFPVPYKTVLNSQDKVSVLCHLEYWSECRNSYLPYTQFCLSESEICHLSLPECCPKTVVASTWRVVITSIDDNTEEPLLNQGGISPRALAACMRIDSYFNKCLIPTFNCAIYITKVELALASYVPKKVQFTMPECLKNYSSDLSFPECQKILTLSLGNLSAYFSTWDFTVWTTELSSSVQATVLDYAYLTEQTFIEPFTSKLEVCRSKSLQCNLISKPFQVMFGPSIAHTLAVTFQIWSQNYISDEKELDFIITTRYVICNDTNVNVRFGQNGTNESILLESRKFHLYSWRSQKDKQYIRVSLEETNWVWSKPFLVFAEGTQLIQFNSEKNLSLFVTVKDVSKTQKQIIFFGQLIVCNMLVEHFEMKIVEVVSDYKEQEFRNARSHLVAGRSVAPSNFIDNRKTYFLRLRFFGLDAAWTGDIPLREHATGSQPWLVKVPLHERGQFLSIWCRIFIQDFMESRRILAMLWPLFMIRSNLPMSAKVHIETPALGVHLDSVVNGKGELQQLHCLGTIDHSHQITFQVEEGNTTLNNPHIPLNYSLVDHRKFFKKFSNEEVDVILESLNHCFESKWPYFEEEFSNVEWITDDNQLLTHVQVKYQNACQHSCALLVELLPWCLMVNTLGTPVCLMLNGIELCRVQHHGIIIPPRLEESFHLGICVGNKWSFSSPLQLAKSDWSQSFYMPKITGSIPLDGIIRTCVKCDSHICMISIVSSISNEIHLLRLTSTHVVSNHLSMQVNVACFAVPSGKELFDFPADAQEHCFTIAPHSTKSHIGIPIIQWRTLKQDVESSNGEYIFYAAFSVNPCQGWSCPLRVDKPMLRKPICLLGDAGLCIPGVVTAQEVKGQIYLALHNDPRPQLFIENTTNASFYCGQSLPDDSIVVSECEHFRWNCKIPPVSGTYYNMPAISEKFPELPQIYFPEKISLSYDSLTEKHNLQWSVGVSIVNNNDLFIRVPYYGDVKLSIVNTACTTFITIQSVSQVEISARDIRVRLSMREKESFIKPATRDTLDENVSHLVSPISTFSSACQVPSSLNQIYSSHSEDTSRFVARPAAMKNLTVNTLPSSQNCDSLKINVFLESISFVLISDIEENCDERCDLLNLVCDDLVVMAHQTECLKVQVSLLDFQIDNQLYGRESFDFPVVLIGQEKKSRKYQNILGMSIETLLENYGDAALIVADFVLESWSSRASGKSYTGLKAITMTINPISIFIEDVYVTKLMRYMKNLNIVELVIWPSPKEINKFGLNSISVNVPEVVSWQCSILAQPLTVRTFVVNPVSLLLSVHSSVKMYIALDQSPLQFAKFERRRVLTTSYRFGHALTMHYLSGAIFGAGWVVSSLELLGSPGGLARAMGTGLRDFVSLPCRGLVQGPMAFLRGITTGSASLMRHVTAGTLQSVTKLASSVARNLDRLTLDEEHLRRTEEQRRQRPQGVTQGFMQGMTSLGISLLGAVGGIAHHPLQCMMSGASPRSIAAGVGLGIVGVFTKPLSGAAELLALTGQGLLQGAGWNSLPNPRSVSIQNQRSTNSTLKYLWKYMDIFSSQVLFVTEVTSVSKNSLFIPVALVLTVDSIVVINLQTEDVLQIVPVSEVILGHNNDPTVLSLKHTPVKVVPKEKVEDELAINMDPEMRARVADYVRSTVALLSPQEDVVSVHSGVSNSPLASPILESEQQDETVVMNYFIAQHKIKYFSCLLNFARQQRDDKHFPVL
ncbi:intermembrane lipid transfer protein VPS13B isoform X1 [Euwallacea similis]|uniref:intermembrane lipid transfer protein VPS13B isoform X1 n=1 Tax=Euwallacea similis TaxID=1736056 RepID=UPI00344B7CD4